MTIKTFERPIIELAQSIAFDKAKFINGEYKLDIKELDAATKFELLSKFTKITDNLDTYLQEFLNDACQDRMYAETQFGGWDE